MGSQTPEIDTDRNEYPSVAEQPPPSLAATTIVWLQLAGATAIVNVVVFFVARALGAEMTVDLGVFQQGVGLPAILVATFGTLFTSTFVWSVVAHRVPAFAHLWVPLGWGVGLVSLGGILGAAGVTTGVALGVMHLLTTAVAAHLIPRQLPR